VQVTEGDGYYLGRVLINAQIAAPLLWAIHIGCPKNDAYDKLTRELCTSHAGGGCSVP
jgi:hypothetical protein